jgi:ABC-type multidrug transport system permease subunit
MLQSKSKVNINPIFYVIIAIIAVNIIAAFPILIIFIIIFFFNGKFNLEKVINNA